MADGGQSQNQAIGFKHCDNVTAKDCTFYIGANAVNNPMSQVPNERDTEDFLRKMENQLDQDTKYDICSKFENLCKVEEHIPIKLVVVDLHHPRGAKNHKGTEINLDQLQGKHCGPINLDQLEGEHCEQYPNHVMLVGEVGAGKSTTAKEYARRVAKSKDMVINLVCYIPVANVDISNTTAADLIMSRCEKLEEKERLAGKDWLEKNRAACLVVLDGLDQSQIEFEDGYSVMREDNKSVRPTVVLANLMSGALYPGMKILSTTRWDTCYNLPENVRSPKTVELRGFNDETVCTVITKLAGASHDEKIFDHLNTKAPKLLALCRNPMILVYTTYIMMEDIENPPDTLAGLMCAVLKTLETSDEHWKRDSKLLNVLSRLAYNGMKDGRFTFTDNYIERCGIDQSKLNTAVSFTAKLLPHQTRPGQGDKEWFFIHQSMQEILAAVHLFKLTQNELNGLIKKELNDIKLEVVRQLFYGMALNEKTKKFAWSFTQDTQGSTEDCKKALLDHLKTQTVNPLSDMKIISLLDECGSNVVKQLTRHISCVAINSDHLNPSNQPSLMHILEQINPLDEAKVDLLIPTRSFLRDLQRLHHITLLQVDELLIGNDCIMSPVEYHSVAATVGKAGVNYLIFKSNELTGETLQVLGEALENEKINLKCLQIGYDYDMNPDAYRSLASTVGKARLNTGTLVFDSNGLTKEKLQAFGEALEKENIKLHCLSIREDCDMDPDAYGSAVRTVGKARVDILVLDNNDLTEEKLEAFCKALEDKNIKLLCLQIWNDCNMDQDAYSSVARTVGKARVDNLMFESNGLTKENLEAFCKALEDENIEFSTLEISHDRNMNPGAYRSVARTVGKGRVNTLQFNNNRLTKEKLEVFCKALKDENIEFDELDIYNDCNMNSDAYRSVATIVWNAGVKELTFVANELTEEKLQAFCEDLEQSIEIEDLGIFKDHNMDPKAYRGLASTVGKACVKNLLFSDNKLTEEKLDEFGQALEKGNIKLPELAIADDCDMNLDAYRSVGRSVGKAGVNKLNFAFMALTKEKLQAFREGLEEENTKIPDLYLFDDEHEPSSEEIEEVCRLRKSVTNVLTLDEWAIGEEDIEKLQNSLNGVSCASSETRIIYNDIEKVLVKTSGKRSQEEDSKTSNGGQKKRKV